MTLQRHPAVAGLFYTADADRLREEIDRLIAGAPTLPHPPKALIAPHAGYLYSGATAGRAYAELKPRSDVICRVVILGPAHRVAVRGLAVSGADAFTTPLGSVPIAADLRHRVLELPQVSISDAAHAEEHAIEVQLPFLQRLLSKFELLPLVVGAATGDEVTEVLQRVWGDDATLIVVSSDLSHYLDYESARLLDQSTTQHILRFEGEALGEHTACGRIPIRGLLATAKAHGLQSTLLDQCNSGDTAGDRQRVVGYAAYAFH